MTENQTSDQPQAISPEVMSRLNAIGGINGNGANEFASELTNSLQDRQALPNDYQANTPQADLFANQQAAPTQQAPVEQPPAQPQATPTQQTPDQAEAPVQTPAQEDPAQPATSDNSHPFLKSIIGSSNTPDQSFQNVDELNQYISTKFDGVNDYSALMSNYEKMQSQLTDLDSVKNTLNQLEQTYEKMPPDLMKAIDLASKGEDWKSYLGSMPSLDFSQSADALNKQDLIKAYFGNQVTDADFDAANPDSENYDVNVKRLVDQMYDQASSRFKADKDNNTLTMQQLNDMNAEQNRLYEESVTQSLGSIRTLIPDANDEYMQSISQDLLQRKNNSLFSNEDGTLKPDASLRYALAKDGPELFKQMAAMIKQQAETDANLDVISRQSATPPGGNSSPSQQQGSNAIRKEVTDHIQQLTGGLNSGSGMWL